MKTMDIESYADIQNAVAKNLGVKDDADQVCIHPPLSGLKNISIADHFKKTRSKNENMVAKNWRQDDTQQGFPLLYRSAPFGCYEYQHR